MLGLLGEEGRKCWRMIRDGEERMGKDREGGGREGEGWGRERERERR